MSRVNNSTKTLGSLNLFNMFIISHNMLIVFIRVIDDLIYLHIYDRKLSDVENLFRMAVEERNLM